MASDEEQVAALMGGRIVAELPDFGWGVLAAAQQARFYALRMAELRAVSASGGEKPLQVPLPSAPKGQDNIAQGKRSAALGDRTKETGCSP
jgi:hypothetical protein